MLGLLPHKGVKSVDCRNTVCHDCYAWTHIHHSAIKINQSFSPSKPQPDSMKSNHKQRSEVPTQSRLDQPLFGKWARAPPPRAAEIKPINNLTQKQTKKTHTIALCSITKNRLFVTLEPRRDSDKLRILLQSFVWETCISDMKIVHKIRSERF